MCRGGPRCLTEGEEEEEEGAEIVETVGEELITEGEGEEEEEKEEEEEGEEEEWSESEDDPMQSGQR